MRNLAAIDRAAGPQPEIEQVDLSADIERPDRRCCLRSVRITVRPGQHPFCEWSPIMAKLRFDPIDEMASPGRASKPDPKLIKLIARAHLLKNRLAESSSVYLADVAQREKLTSSYFTRVLRLSYLAPDITRAILEGRHPRD